MTFDPNIGLTGIAKFEFRHVSSTVQKRHVLFSNVGKDARIINVPTQRHL
jgi:hypothetical protein